MNKDLFKLILRAVALGVSVGTLVCSIMDKIQAKSAITLLAIGIICLAIAQLQDK
jgi:hypothetical protein